MEISTNTINSAELLEKLTSKLIKRAATTKKLPLIVLMGPTASGKTGLGIKLAQLVKGEIISADSRQIYKEMSICTAAPTAEEQAQIKHYLVEFLNPDQPYSLADFQRDARNRIEKISAEGKIPVLVGGTGLYINSIIYDYKLSKVSANQSLRQKYEELAIKSGNEAVFEQLKKVDAQKAAEIGPHNLRYLIRALELSEKGEKSSDDQQHLSPNYEILLLQIDWPREQLYQRIEKRIDIQLSTGLLEETKALINKSKLDLPALSSLGFRETSAYLRGDIKYDEAVLLFKRNTRHYAKRQLTWFRKLQSVYFIPGGKLKLIIDELDDLRKNSKKSAINQGRTI